MSEFPISQTIFCADKIDYCSNSELDSLQPSEIDFFAAVKLYELYWSRKRSLEKIGPGRVFRFTSLNSAIWVAEQNRKPFWSFEIHEDIGLAVFSGHKCFVVTSDMPDWGEKFSSYPNEQVESQWRSNASDENKIVRLPVQSSRFDWLNCGPQLKVGNNVVNFLASLKPTEKFRKNLEVENLSVHQTESLMFTNVLTEQDCVRYKYKSRSERNPCSAWGAPTSYLLIWNQYKRHEPSPSNLLTLVESIFDSSFVGERLIL